MDSLLIGGHEQLLRLVDFETLLVLRHRRDRESITFGRLVGQQALVRLRVRVVLSVPRVPRSRRVARHHLLRLLDGLALVGHLPSTTKQRAMADSKGTFIKQINVLDLETEEANRHTQSADCSCTVFQSTRRPIFMCLSRRYILEPEGPVFGGEGN